MSQTHKVGKHRTTIEHRASDNTTYIRYWNTDVVAINNHFVTLDHGNWMSATTKLRMNQAASEFRLGFKVFQKNFEWFVVVPEGKVVPYGTGRRFTFSYH
jgi:hypothetical protein